MNSFSVLEASNSEQRQTWIALWERWPEREVSAHPNYALLFATPGDCVLCAALETAEGGILFPLILRPLERESWAHSARAMWDATSPYGYGGPYCWKCQPDEVHQFWTGLRHWANEQAVVSLVARLSLFPEQLAEFDGTVVDIMPNVVRSLELTPEALWLDYKHGVRKAVKRAQREDVRVEVDPSASRLDEFLAIYHDTMDRRAASAFYRFDRGFFERLMSGLPGQFVFFHAVHDGRVVATDLSLLSTHHIHSFLGGTAEQALKLHANSLLTHEIILWGMRSGRSSYILGGGYGEADSIFNFKSQFAPRGTMTFRVGQMVFDSRAYDDLVRVRQDWEAAQGREWQPRPRFFPAYRA